MTFHALKDSISGGTVIYLIGGAPRVGKTTLAHQISARLGIGWISTDALITVLRAKQVVGIKTEWNASPEAIVDAADWFFPCLERLIWSLNSLTDSYVIEGVDFLPSHAVKLESQYPVRSVFLRCAAMTPEHFDAYPGHSLGYANLPDEMRRRFALDIPRWTEFVRQEARRYGCPFVDVSEDFSTRLVEAATLLAPDDEAESP